MEIKKEKLEEMQQLNKIVHSFKKKMTTILLVLILAGLIVLIVGLARNVFH